MDNRTRRVRPAGRGSKPPDTLRVSFYHIERNTSAISGDVELQMMTTRYGLTVEQWERAKDEMRAVLVNRARLRGMIPYSELVQEMHTVHLDANDYALGAMLGEVSTEEDEAGRGMLSVIVV